VSLTVLGDPHLFCKLLLRSKRTTLQSQHIYLSSHLRLTGVEDINIAMRGFSQSVKGICTTMLLRAILISVRCVCKNVKLWLWNHHLAIVTPVWTQAMIDWLVSGGAWRDRRGNRGILKASANYLL